MKQYFVYILASHSKNLYIGVTNDLLRRVSEHKQKMIEGFTKKYNIDQLVYYETTDSIMSAIEREKQLKNWHREWKIDLIEKKNPEWHDLYEDFE